MSKKSELEKKLAEARRARLEAQSALEEQADIARMERELEDEPHIAKAVADIGAIGKKIAVLHTEGGAVIVRSPQQAVWRRFADSDQVDGKSLYPLIQSCLVYPSAARLEQILEESPAALEMLGGLVSKLAAGRTDVLAGK